MPLEAAPPLFELFIRFAVFIAWLLFCEEVVVVVIYYYYPAPVVEPTDDEVTFYDWYF